VHEGQAVTGDGLEDEALPAEQAGAELAVEDDVELGAQPCAQKCVPLAPDPATDLFDQEYENVSARFEIDWRPFADTLVFVSFNRGHTVGNARTSAAGLPNVEAQRLPTWPHDEEVLHSWEAGVKTTFWNGRARLNANVFYRLDPPPCGDQRRQRVCY